MTGIPVGGTTKFGEIYGQLSRSDLKQGQHVRADFAGTSIYRSTNPLSTAGLQGIVNKDALLERNQKQAGGAQSIKTALANEYGQPIADRVFQNVGQAKGRDLDTDLRWK